MKTPPSEQIIDPAGLKHFTNNPRFALGILDFLE
jgi:hypothetical protein